MEYTAKKIADKLNISRSYLYHLKDIGAVDITKNDKGQILWTDEVYSQLKDYIADNKEVLNTAPVTYKTMKINNRRYLGNKYKLLSFIKRIVQEECNNIRTIADIFAGTGVVASAFTDKKIITNDNLYSNYICHVAWFSNEEYDKNKIVRLIENYNKKNVLEDNYMSNHFANTYFSLADCRKIGFIRQDIEDKYLMGEVNTKERALLITSLIYAMDRIANTCGHYDAYRKGVVLENKLELAVPEPDTDLNDNNLCFNMDTNELVKNIKADLVYIDPPYNSRQYCDAYHLLENVALWKKPEVFGVAKKMDRKALKSDYCTKKATEAFEELIESVDARYILLSYNNMAEKGNERSNAKIKDDDIMRILSKKGTVKIFSEEYRAFTTGKSDIQGNQERLFLCICHDKKKKVIPSALNYTGGKYKLLPQLLPLFPDRMDKMVDLFCGGCNVGINVNCSKVFFNDSNAHLIGLLNVLKKTDKKEVFKWIFDNIEKYNLSLVSEDGYEYYGCNSVTGLSKYNKEGFQKLRNDFNSRIEKDNDYYLMLYLLIVYAFNNQIRFNSKGEFNLPVGKRDFNKKMQSKLSNFIERIRESDYSFINLDFRDMDINTFTNESFVYVDPPYLIACATYNEQNGWTEKDEKDLLFFLERLNKAGVRFALSNLLESNGKKNTILEDWIADNNFRVIFLNYDYSNSNYQKKRRDKDSQEILVVNY